MKDNFQGTYFSAHLLRFWIFIRKITRIALELIFFVSQKFVTYKILNTLKLFSFTVDSSVLLNEGFRFSFMTFVMFFVCVADCQSSRNLKPNLFYIFRVFLITDKFHTLYVYHACGKSVSVWT